MIPPSLSLAGKAVMETGACDKAFSADFRMRSRSIEATSTTTLGATGVPATTDEAATTSMRIKQAGVFMTKADH